MPSTLIVCNSSPEAGAVNVSSTKDSFDLEFPSPIEIPRDSKPRVSVAEATLRFDFPNLSTLKNNRTFYYTDTALNLTKWAITLPDGLWDIDHLNAELARGFTSRGHPSNLFTLTGDLATNKIRITKIMNVPGSFGYCMYWPADSPWSEIGATLGTTTPPGGGPSEDPYSALMPNRAILNTTESVVLHCSLTSGASYLGGQASSAVASIDFGDAKPQQQVYYRPNYALPIDVPRLAGSLISRISLRLTNQTGQRNTIQTQEDWSATILLEW